MPTSNGRRGSIAGSITGSIKLSTSRVVGKLKLGISQLLSIRSGSKRRDSLASPNGSIFDTSIATDEQPDSQQFKGQASFLGNWIPISKAGSGGQVDVYFVIGRDWLDSATFKHISKLNKAKEPGKEFQGAKDDLLPSLVSGIQVVKIPNCARRTVLDRHRMKVHGISDTTDFTTLRDFGKDSLYTPHLIDWDREADTDAPAWTVQEAFNCGTLFDFSHVWASLHPSTTPDNAPQAAAWPEALIWHVFIELALALHFIHCAGVAHCDLVAFNICLHMPEHDAHAAAPRFPRVIPIDYGRARTAQSMAGQACSWDTTRLGDLLHEIVHAQPFHAAPAASDAQTCNARPDRDAVTGLCARADDGVAAESRLSARGQALFREVLRYTAPAHTVTKGTTAGVSAKTTTATAQKTKRRKTMDDVVLKLVPQARKARAEAYRVAESTPGELARLEQVLQSIVRRRFPSEDLIWERMRAARKVQG